MNLRRLFGLPPGGVAKLGSSKTDVRTAEKSRPKFPASRLIAPSGRRKPQTARFSAWQRLQILLISRLGWLLVWIVNWTARYRVEDWNNYQSLRDRDTPVILSFWHNQIFSATYFWRFRGIVVITSRHFDGEYIARIIQLFGYGAARGSSSRGAVRALLQLKRTLARGRDVAFTIDGPRGPLYKVKPGPLWLSRKTGLPIVPFHVQPRSFWTLNSWDGFRIPKPFTEIVVRIGRPFVVPPDGDEEEWTSRYQEAMDALRRSCEPG